MSLTDAAKIAIAVSAPSGFFLLLFAVAYSYRRRLHQRSTPRDESPPDVWPKCQICTERHPAHHMNMPKMGSMEGSRETLMSLSLPPRSRQTVARSVSQPHFEEKSITIKRLSSVPGQPPDLMRLNSISSSLNSLEPVNSRADMLPYGGRRSSIGGGLAVSLPGDLPLYDPPGVPKEGVVPVQRVLVQKGEGHARLRSSSGSTYGSPTDPRFRKVALPDHSAPRTVDFTIGSTDGGPAPSNAIAYSKEDAASMVVITSPSSLVQHIRSPTLPPLPRHPSLSDQIHSALSLPKSSANTSKLPGSIALVHSNSSKPASPTQSVTAPKSTDKAEAAQSPTPDTAGSVFAAWKGFPPRLPTTPSGAAVSPEPELLNQVTDHPAVEQRELETQRVSEDLDPKGDGDGVGKRGQRSASWRSSGKITFLADEVDRQSRARSSGPSR